MKTSEPSKQDILKKIGDRVQLRIDAAKIEYPLQEMRSRIDAGNRQPFDFKKSLQSPKADYAIISEIKKASPSQGDIAPHLDVVEVAKQYLDAKATALSILTEEDFFKGKLDYLREVRRNFPEARILMKDFFVDEYQLYQARDAGADAILIIVALLGEQKSERFLNLAGSLGLTALVEVHTAEEVAIANRIGADLVGINSRNLKDMSVSLDRIVDLVPKVNPGATIVGESGIESQQDLDRLKEAGCNAFLVGTRLMGTGTPGAALHELMGTNPA